MSVTNHSWYRGRGTLRNGNSARALDRVLGEALAREVTRGLEAGPPALDDPLGSSALRLECADDGLDELCSDASPDQVVTDQGVSGASLGEERGAATGDTLVVDRAGSNQSPHRLGSGSGGDLCP